MTTFAIIEGIGEGPIISRRFRKQLESTGWQRVPEATADVIITHSGGLYLLPSKLRAKQFVHIHCTQNMPMKQLVVAHNSKIRYDMAKRRAKGAYQTMRGLLNLGANGWYHLNLRRSLRMRTGFIDSDAFCANLPAGTHVFVCGLDDSLSEPSYFLQHTSANNIFVSVEGGHDDCWREPERYVPTIQSLIS